MASTTIVSALQKQKWITNYFAEYTRESQFQPYMGSKETSIFVTKYELQEESGKTINIPLVTNLGSPGARGNGLLDGFEEELGTYNCAVSIDWLRNGVRIPKSTSYQTELDLFNAAKGRLKRWGSVMLRSELIKYMSGPITGTVGSSTNSVPSVAIIDNQGATITAAATAANFNTWSAANADRILYGAATSNYSATHATGLATVDSTNDKLTTATASLAKRMARAASPAITPFQIEDGREYFVMFCGARAFRDLKLDSAMLAANRDSRSREAMGMKDNPIFQDGDLLYDGIIFREVPEISTVVTTSATFVTAGNGSISVEPNFLCGSQAMAIAWGQEPTPREDLTKDYKFRPGVAIEELRGIQKVNFNGKQHGMVTLYTSGLAD